MKIDKNIELHGNYLRLVFYYKKVKCSEGLLLENTSENLKQMQQLRDDIQMDIRRNRFKYSEYFPNSPRVKIFEVQPKSYDLKTLFEQQLDFYIRSKYAENTLRDYTRYIRDELIPEFGKILITELTPSRIKDWILTRKQTSKYVRNLLIPFKAVLDEAKNDEIIKESPLDKLSLNRLFKCFDDDSDYVVEPFNLQERRQILGYADGQIKNFIQFGLYSGLRIGEILALQWSNFNPDKKTMQVNHTMVNGSLHTPKTKSSIREVKLLPQAFDAIIEQKKFTHESDFIFNNPNTGSRWRGTDAFRKHWVRLFAQINVKYRNPYQMRHTFASMLVSKGENTYKVAKYLGHKDTEMVIKVYGKYIPLNEAEDNFFSGNYEEL